MANIIDWLKKRIKWNPEGVFEERNASSSSTSQTDHFNLSEATETEPVAVLKRFTLTEEQYKVLEKAFQVKRYPPVNVYHELAHQTGISVHFVILWFMNRRHECRLEDGDIQHMLASQGTLRCALCQQSIASLADYSVHIDQHHLADVLAKLKR